jgi:hypothetical protein
MLKRSTIIETVTVLNIILFLYTGIAKIMDYSIFKEQLATSPVLPENLSKPVALLLPWMEFAVVLMLLIPRWRTKGLYATLVLMFFFTGYIIALFSFSKEMPCSCGGIIELLSWKQHLMFNAVFMLLDALAIRLIRKEKKERMKEWNVTNDYQVSHS